MITSCLMAAGYRVGLYTSPHLSEFTERIQVNGQEIEKGNLADLVDCLNRTLPGFQSLQLLN